MNINKKTSLSLSIFLLLICQVFAQDDPCSALSLTYGISGVGDNSSALGDDRIVSCFSDKTIDNDVWWSFEASSNGAIIYTEDVGLGNSDTQLAIYSSSDNSCAGKFTLISCNEDISSTNWMSSTKVCDLIPGHTYYVQVDGWAGASGGFEIEMIDSPNCVICEPINAKSGEFAQGLDQVLCSGERAWFSISDFNLPEDPYCQASGGMFVLPADRNASGGPFNGAGFIWTNPDLTGEADYIERCSFGEENPLEGFWEIYPAVFTDARLNETYDEASSSMMIEFLSVENSRCMSDTTCIAGTVFNQDQVTCQLGGSIDLTLSADHDLPLQGDFYWLIQNEERTMAYTYNFGNDPSFYQFVGDLNHLLELNGQPTLSAGAWFLQGVIVDNIDMQICDVTDVVILTLLGIGEEGCEAEPCAAFNDPPTGLTKSFEPVNGVEDRVQLKWYKEEPQIRYSDEDAAMCDIQFWGIKNLDPSTGAVVGNISPVDTIQISNVKKTYADNSPRQIFKWPIKYRKDGANNSKRVDPNVRYLWRLRCECGHDGNGMQSPWSQIKLFNTPDFDPVSGINSSGGVVTELFPDLKSSFNGAIKLRPASMNSCEPIKNLPRLKRSVKNPLSNGVHIYPNPARESLNISTKVEASSLQVRDATGRTLMQVKETFVADQLNISILPEGIYLLELEIKSETVRRPFVVKR